MPQKTILYLLVAAVMWWPICFQILKCTQKTRNKACQRRKQNLLQAFKNAHKPTNIKPYIIKKKAVEPSVEHF